MGIPRAKTRFRNRRIEMSGDIHDDPVAGRAYTGEYKLCKHCHTRKAVRWGRCWPCEKTFYRRGRTPISRGCAISARNPKGSAYVKSILPKIQNLERLGCKVDPCDKYQTKRDGKRIPYCAFHARLYWNNGRDALRHYPQHQ